MTVDISLDDAIDEAEVLALYQANQWSSADKPQQLLAALRNSHSLVTARRDGRLLGLGNAISDGHLVVYYPHMLVHPEVQGAGYWPFADECPADTLRRVPSTDADSRWPRHRFL